MKTLHSKNYKAHFLHISFSFVLSAVCGVDSPSLVQILEHFSHPLCVFVPPTHTVETFKTAVNVTKSSNIT